MSEPIILTKAEFNTDIPFRITKYSYDNYDDIKLHAHEFVEIAYVCRGKGLHVINGKQYEVSRGDVYIINFDMPHSFYPYDRSNSDGLCVFNLLFMPEFIEKMNIELELLNKIIGIFLYKSIFADELEYTADIKLTGVIITEFEAVCEKMLMEYTFCQEGYVEVLKISLCELLIKLYRASKAHNFRLSDVDAYKHQLISEAMHYISDNYSAHLQLENISRQVFLSKSYFSALFKKATGMSIIEYLQKTRIEKACQLISTGNYKITRIAEMVGYSDYRFFNKTFQKFMGLTAIEYKKKH